MVLGFDSCSLRVASGLGGWLLVTWFEFRGLLFWVWRASGLRFGLGLLYAGFGCWCCL